MNSLITGLIVVFIEGMEAILGLKGLSYWGTSGFYNLEVLFRF